jgi:hypothetical protein
MSEIENLFNEDLLVPNLKGAAYFILLYEHFEDVVITCVKEFYSHFCMINGVPYSSIDDEYIKALQEKVDCDKEKSVIPYRRLLNQAKKDRETYRQEILHSNQKNERCEDAKRLRGSLRWLRENGVFSDLEVNNIFKIRNRRNNIVHELLKVLGEGLTEEDATMIANLLEYNGRVNNWRFQQIDMPALAIKLPDGATPEDVISGDDVALMGVFRILFYGEGEEFKEELKKTRNRQDDI